MKSFLIVVSLAINLGFVAAFALRPALAPPAFRDFFARNFSSAVSSETTASPAAKSNLAQSVAPVAKPGEGKLWSTLPSDDLHALVARLQADGFPVWVIRAIVQAELESRYGARVRALSQNDPDAPFWKSGIALTDPKRLAEYTRLTAERSNLTRELLGDFAKSDNGQLTAEQRRRYGNLSPSKIALIDRINQDYADLGREMRAAMNGIVLPEDREKLAVLDQEKRADLAATLSPEELADYDLRTSPVVARLRTTFDIFKVTEEEFRSIYAIQQAYSSRIDFVGNAIMTMAPDERTRFLSQRTPALQELDSQMQAALGEARYAEFTRASDRDFQQLSQLAARENLPSTAAVEGLAVRDRLTQESNRIFNDGNLSYDQKLASLQALAQSTRSQFRALLGPSAGEAYLRSAERWLNTVEHGGAVTFTREGFSSRALPNPNAPQRPPVPDASSGLIFRATSP